MNIKTMTIGFFAVDAVLIGIGAFLYVNQDRTAPVISVPETAMIYDASMTQEELLEGVTAYDAQEGDVTDRLFLEKISDMADGRVLVTYAASDSSNNISEKSRILEIGTAGHHTQQKEQTE